METPDFIGQDFSPMLDALRAGPSVDPNSSEDFRLYLEDGNRSLERFRVGLEKLRSDGRVPLGLYKQGISDYRNGIQSYRDGMSVIQGQP